MYYDDFYYEPSEFEQQIDEFKNAILLSVKEEYKDEMERLKKENAELQEFKEGKERIEREYEEKYRQAKREMADFERSLKNKRLVELLGENPCVGWFVDEEYKYPPKCNKCEEDRKIPYALPSGEIRKEPCHTCGNAFAYLFPSEIRCFSFEQEFKGTQSKEYYFFERDRDDDDTFSSQKRVYRGEEFKDLPTYGDLVFWDKDMCQKYCDWRNFNAK